MGCRGGVPRPLSEVGALAGICGREPEPGHTASHLQHHRHQARRGAAHPAGVVGCCDIDPAVMEGRGGKPRPVPLGEPWWVGGSPVGYDPCSSSGLGDSGLSPWQTQLGP